MGTLPKLGKSLQIACLRGFGRPGREIITFDDGRVISKRVGAALGRGMDNPLPVEALTAKFANCAGRALPPAQVERLHRVLLQLDEAPSLRAVVATIAA